MMAACQGGMNLRFGRLHATSSDPGRKLFRVSLDVVALELEDVFQVAFVV